MAKKIMYVTAGIALFAASCGGNQEQPKEIVVTDTINTVTTQIVEVPAEVDTAAIIAFYAAEHAKAKGTKHTKTKAKGTKKVSVDSDPTFVADDVMPVSKPVAETTPAAPEAAATPAPAPAPVIKVVHDVQMFYFIPDEKATFPGGEKAFDQYLMDNLEYPEKALEAGVSRTVYPTVFLDELGNPVDIKFRYEPTIYGFQDEARRILMASPRWNPAKVGGKPVKSKFTVPIVFKIH
jgi:hypothetical protein